VPTEFIFQGTYSSVAQAKEAAGKLAHEKRRVLDFTVVQSVDTGESMTLNDVPIQFGAHKRYRDRQVTIMTEV
jgi:CRISPR system Cascade subunit CasD